MTPDEINAAIAETQGWKICEANWLGFTDRNPSPRRIPNYHGSLDAIVPVVRAMERGEMVQVIMHLYHMMPITPVFNCYLSTPAQWCEAYLKAKGLWK